MTATSQPDLCLPTKHRCKQCNVKSTEIFINPAQKSAGECAGGNHSQVWEQAFIPVGTDQMVINNELTAPATLTTAVTALSFTAGLRLGELSLPEMEIWTHHQGPSFPKNC